MRRWLLSAAILAPLAAGCGPSADPTGPPPAGETQPDTGKKGGKGGKVDSGSPDEPMGGKKLRPLPKG